MALGLVGKKIGMTQVFDQDGNLVPVTVLEMGPNRVIQVKRQDGNDGYTAVRLGFGDVKAKKVNRPMQGVFHHAKVEATRWTREIRVDEAELASYPQGTDVSVTLFTPGELVDVTGTSKGRGYQGVVKRHGFKGAKESSHGTHEYKRHAGSIGCSAWPAHVIKGKKMAGQMGGERVTVKGLEIVAIYPDDQIVLVRGAVPGAKNGLVTIRQSRHRSVRAAA